MYTSLKTTKNKQSFILYQTTKQNTPPPKPQPDQPNTTQHTHIHTTNTSQTPKRTQTQLGTHDYNRSLRRAFSRSKLLAYFNPDLNQFLTLTYKTSTHTPEQVIQDIKNLIKKHNKNKPKTLSLSQSPAAPNKLAYAWHESGCTKITTGTATPQQNNSKKQYTYQLGKTATLSDSREREVERGQGAKLWKPFKYIYVLEYQKRGSIHVHMVCNDALRTHINKNGHLELTDWTHGKNTRKGFSSLLTIKDFDNNFKPYLYLFKYMSKAQRIGSIFIHTSKNFDKIETVDYHDYIQFLTEENLLFEEDQEFNFDNTDHRIIKKYFKTREA